LLLSSVSLKQSVDFVDAILAYPGDQCEPSDVILIVDETISIKKEEHAVQVQFVLDMAYKLFRFSDNRVGYVTFSSIPYLVSPLTNDQDAFITTVTSRPYYPSLLTIMSNGIALARSQFAQE
jgi:hypothetical protein